MGIVRSIRSVGGYVFGGLQRIKAGERAVAEAREKERRDQRRQDRFMAGRQPHKTETDKLKEFLRDIHEYGIHQIPNETNGR